MSLRTLGRLLLLLALATSVYWLYPALQLGGLWRQGSDAYKRQLVKQATPAIVYEIPQRDWLEFPLDPGTTQLKIISSATVRDLAPIKQAMLADPDKRWTYALQIEVFDRAGRLLLAQPWHMRTNLSLFKDAQGREYTPAFYLDNDRVPLLSSIVRLNFAGLPQPDRLRLRLLRKDADIHDVVARVYLPEKIHAHKIGYLWQRLSEKTRAALAAGNVYPTELLTEEEKRALMLNSWQPIGPKYRHGELRRWDYYMLRDNEGEMIDSPIAGAGLHLAVGHSGMVPLPEAGGRLRLHFEAGGGIPPSQGDIRLKWYGNTAFQRREFRLHFDGRPLDYRLDLGGGLLEILADANLSARIHLIDGKGGETEITPAPQYLRTYRTDPTHPIEYRILHVGVTDTPIKVDLRYLTPPTESGAEHSPPIDYAFLDQDGKVLKQGLIAISKPDSLYDSLANDHTGARLSDPSTYYFLLPANVTSLRLRGVDEDEPVLVAVHSRPLDLPHRYRAPEDQFDFDAQGKRISAWFPLKPENHVQLLADNASVLLTVQPRPAKDNPELLTGRYVWEDFHPLGDWKGRLLLTPQEPGTPFRSEALPSSYQDIVPNRDITVMVPAYEGLRTITPRLMWVRPRETPASFSLYVDGRLHQQGRLAGRHGEIELAPLGVGRHRLRLVSEAGGKLFLNHLEPSSPVYLKRLANQLEDTLVFVVARTTYCEETLSVSLFQPSDRRVRSRLRVEVRGPAPGRLTPLSAWLFTLREFDVRPERRDAVAVFSTQDALTDAGQSFYLPFPAGAPKGLYRITIRLHSGPGGHILLSRLTPGVKPTQRLLHENDSATYENTQD